MNKKQILLTVLVTIILSAVVAITAFIGYIFYKAIGTVNQDHAVLVDIVNLINKSQTK